MKPYVAKPYVGAPNEHGAAVVAIGLTLCGAVFFMSIALTFIQLWENL
jgi:hypothetical protein